MPDHESSSDSTLSTSEHDATMESFVQPAVSRSNKLWLDDGSVVLQAENTQFRVHRSMLSRHSQVFRDMFSVPQPMGSEDTVEGCPIVHLSDSVQDVSHLLSALYDQGYASRQVLTFPVVAAMLRLGSKYDFHHLKEKVLLRLRAELPTTLEDWDKLTFGFTYIKEQDGLLFDIVNLALEHGLFSILPGAYYLATDDIKSILKGKIRDDGSRAILVPESQQACILGIQKIVEAQATTTLSWLDDDLINGCTSSRQCAWHRSYLAISIYKQADPYFSLTLWEDIDKEPLCKACLKDAKEKHNAGRSKMWDMMPENFGFPPWDQLKKLDRY